jgi:hypothetical protein
MKQSYPANRRRPGAAPSFMKTQLVVGLGVTALLSGLTTHARGSQSAPHRDLTIWVQGQGGSRIGSGYASSYLTNIRSKTLANEDPKIRQAIDSLDGLGMLPVRGFGLVPAAVAWETKTPMRKLIEEQAETRLSYGELLLAHSLAAQAKESFARIIDMRVRTRTWGDLTEQLGVSPDFIVTRAKIAADRIRDVDFWTRRRPGREAGTNYTSINPHTQRAHLQ